MDTVWQPVFKSGDFCEIETVLLRGLFSELSKKQVCPFVLQFLTFSERLSNVNIDIIHRIDRTGSCAEVRTVVVVFFWNHITSSYASESFHKTFIQEEFGKKLLQELPFLEPYFVLCSPLFFHLLSSIVIGALWQPPSCWLPCGWACGYFWAWKMLLWQSIVLGLDLQRFTDAKQLLYSQHMYKAWVCVFIGHKE